MQQSNFLVVGSPSDSGGELMRGLTSFPKSKIKVLLLEGVSEVAVRRLRAETFDVETVRSTLPPDQLKQKISEVHAIGIRSVTELTEDILKHASRALCVGCFCIGYNQVDLQAAQRLGIPVFNSPFCNTRSVAELIIAQIISLARRLGDRNKELHSGIWNKSAKGCFEVRGKVLGIVGYGHIGSQLSVMAEAMGMRVLFHDIIPKLALGNSRQVDSLDTLLKEADFLSLHVPATPETRNMIAAPQIALLKPGSYLLNASRGKVVDIPALANALKSGHLAGAYVDVYPVEPRESQSKSFESELIGCPNTILSPHIGGSTEEAQEAIGEDVASKLINFINLGSTVGAVNFPEVAVPLSGPTAHRILNIHHNRPGVLKDINNILSEFNVTRQVLGTQGSVGYLIVEVDREASKHIKEAITKLPANIRTRILF
eukprot:TRINITY_DN6478_c0_g1_i1.p1 TRINITY_DN6478_c0_g1~~TRINITY_DN6478_c0_g1_i1.p1  ORF type:complete len:429 (+),score=79.88 TRINITY_DN6478_c0_g1_i1:99-1385(+)